MNTKCPQCGQPVSDDFGVIVCPHCQAVLFVDLAGNIQLSDATSAAVQAEQDNENLGEAAEQEEAVYAMNDVPPEGLDFSHLPSADPQAQETQFGTLARFHTPEPENPIEEILDAEFAGPEEEIVVEAEEFFATESPQFQENPLLPKEPGLDEPAVEETTPIDDFVDHEAVTGPMTYTVTIEHIDTKNLRTQLQDVFDDPKFQWSSSDLMKRIRQGKITLKNLSPVKASVLISRIKEMPLKISWIQQVFK